MTDKETLLKANDEAHASSMGMFDKIVRNIDQSYEQFERLVAMYPSNKEELSSIKAECDVLREQLASLRAKVTAEYLAIADHLKNDRFEEAYCVQREMIKDVTSVDSYIKFEADIIRRCTDAIRDAEKGNPNLFQKTVH